MEVDEARSGDLDLADQIIGGERIHDGLRKLARVTPCGFCELQRDIGREVSMRRVARAIDLHGRLDVSRKDIGRQRRERSLNETFDLVLHWQGRGVEGSVSLQE